MYRRRTLSTDNLYLLMQRNRFWTEGTGRWREKQEADVINFIEKCETFLLEWQHKHNRVSHNREEGGMSES